MWESFKQFVDRWIVQPCARAYQDVKSWITSNNDQEEKSGPLDLDKAAEAIDDAASIALDSPLFRLPEELNLPEEPHARFEAYMEAITAERDAHEQMLQSIANERDYTLLVDAIHQADLDGDGKIAGDAETRALWHSMLGADTKAMGVYREAMSALCDMLDQIPESEHQQLGSEITEVMAGMMGELFDDKEAQQLEVKLAEQLGTNQDVTQTLLRCKKK